MKRRYECFGEQATAQKKKHENKFAQDVIVQDTIVSVATLEFEVCSVLDVCSRHFFCNVWFWLL